MKAQHITTSSRLGGDTRRHLLSGKRVEPRILKMRPQPRKCSPEETPANRIIVEALAALVLLLAMLLVLLTPE